jgi:hypothetical protein
VTGQLHLLGGSELGGMDQATGEVV